MAANKKKPQKTKKLVLKKAPPAKAKKAPPKKTAPQKTTPKAKPQAASAAPGPRPVLGPAALAKVLGVTLREPLEPSRLRALRRALPGANGMLHAAAKALEGEALDLGLGDVSAKSLRQTAAHREQVHALEDIARAVYRSLHEERLVLDDAATGQLQKIARRAGAHSEDHPEVLKRWRFLRDFLAQPAEGRRAPRVADEDESLDEASAEG